MLSFKGKLMFVLIKASACGPFLIWMEMAAGPPESAESTVPRLVETEVLVTGVHLQLGCTGPLQLLKSYWSNCNMSSKAGLL